MPTQSSLTSISGEAEKSTPQDSTVETQATRQFPEDGSASQLSEPTSSSGQSFTTSGCMSGNLDRHTSAASEQWIADMETADRPHAYFNIDGITASSLSGVQTAVDIKRVTVAGPDGQLHSSYGGGQSGIPSPDTVETSTYLKTILEKAVDWKLSRLAYPEHPLARTIADEDIRIFVAPMIEEAMRNASVAVDQVLAEAEKIESPPATDDYIRSVKRENTLPKYNTEGPQPKRAVYDLEHVAAQRFGIAQKRSSFDYEQYDVFSLNCLKSKLDTARKAVEAVDKRQSELRKFQSECRSEWVEVTKDTVFSGLF